MRREYISIWRRPMTLTLPATQTRDLSLRSTSVHIVNSLSSFFELSSSRICSASSIAFLHDVEAEALRPQRAGGELGVERQMVDRLAQAQCALPGLLGK